MAITNPYEKLSRLRDVILTTLILIAVVAAPAAAQNVVTHWAAVAQSAIVVGRTPASSNVLHAMVQLAMYDAVIAIEGGYEPYATGLIAAPGTNVNAAVATAAYRVLRERVPGQFAFLDNEYAIYLVAIADGQSKSNGIAVGEAVAAAILALRENDGFDNVIPYVQPPPGPGVFEPVAPTTPIEVKLGQVSPYTFDDPAAFRPNGPAPLASNEYAENFIETRDYGRSNSTFRSPEQTDIALFWAENPYTQWNRNLRNIAITNQLNIAETARMMAMAFTADADALIGCLEAKYFYMWWRPVHAIQRAGADGNLDTDPDPTWTALLTVNFPEYPSAHACLSTAITDALTAYFGTNNFSVTLDSTMPALFAPVRTYRKLNDVAREVDDARVWGGLHWRNSMKEGDKLGRKVAAHIVRHFFRPTE